jgi:hypothetical protein
MWLTPPRRANSGKAARQIQKAALLVAKGLRLLAPPQK